MPADTPRKSQCQELFGAVQDAAQVARSLGCRGAIRRAFRALSRASPTTPSIRTSPSRIAGSSVRVALDRTNRARHHQSLRSRFHSQRRGAGSCACPVGRARSGFVAAYRALRQFPRSKRFDAATAAATPEHRGRGRRRSHSHRRKRGPNRRRHLLHRPKRRKRSSIRAASPPGTPKPWRSSPSPPWPTIAPAGPKASAVSHAFHRSRWRWPAAPPKRRVSRAILRRSPPGRYTVILEPAAVLDLVGQMFGDFSATAIADSRSFLTRPHRQETVRRQHPNLRRCRSSAAGRRAFRWRRRPAPQTDSGGSGRSARSRLLRDPAPTRAGVEPTGHGFPLPNEVGEAPLNIVIAGGSTSLDEMIASTERGVLVTRLWYIREVDPYEKIMTGMTRDGTFLIENGRVSAGPAQFPLQPGHHRNAEQRGSAFALRARLRRRGFRHGGAGHEGPRLQFH